MGLDQKTLTEIVKLNKLLSTSSEIKDAIEALSKSKSDLSTGDTKADNLDKAMGVVEVVSSAINKEVTSEKEANPGDESTVNYGKRLDTVTLIFLALYIVGVFINTYTSYQFSLTDIVVGFGAFKGADVLRYGIKSKYNTIDGEDPDHVETGLVKGGK